MKAVLLGLLFLLFTADSACAQAGRGAQRGINAALERSARVQQSVDRMQSQVQRNVSRTQGSGAPGGYYRPAPSYPSMAPQGQYVRPPSYYPRTVPQGQFVQPSFSSPQISPQGESYHPPVFYDQNDLGGDEAWYENPQGTVSTPKGVNYGASGIANITSSDRYVDWTLSSSTGKGVPSPVRTKEKGYLSPPSFYSPTIPQGGEEGVKLPPVEARNSIDSEFAELVGDTTPNESPHLWIRTPENSRISFSVPMSLAREVESGWKKYYFSNFNYEQGITISITVTHETMKTRREETRTYHANKDHRIVRLDFNWISPKDIDREQERREIAYQKAIDGWIAWEQLQEQTCKTLENSLGEWLARERTVAEAEKDKTLTKALIAKLDEGGAALEKALESKREDLLHLKEQVRKYGAAKLELPADSELQKMRIQEELRDNSGALEKMRSGYTNFLQIERKVSEYRLAFLMPWQEKELQKVQKWHEETLDKHVGAPSRELEKMAKAYRAVMDPLEPGTLRDRMEFKLAEEMKARQTQLADSKIAEEISAQYNSRGVLYQRVFDYFLMDLRANGNLTVANARWEVEKVAAAKEREVLEKRWDKKSNDLVADWLALPSPQQVLDQQKSVVSRFAKVNEKLQQETAMFLRAFSEPIPMATSISEARYSEEKETLKKVEGKLVIEEVTRLIEAEWERRRTLLKERAELVTKEVNRRRAVSDAIALAVLAQIESGESDDDVAAWYEAKRSEDRGDQQKFEEAYLKTLWDEKATPTALGLERTVAALYPWQLKISPDCSQYPIKLNKNGLIEFYPDGKVDGTPLMTAERADIINVACEKELLVVLLRKAVSENLQSPRWEESNRTLEDLKDGKQDQGMVLFFHRSDLLLVYGPESDSGSLSHLWKSAEGRFMVLEKLDGTDYFHSFGLDGRDHDVVQSVGIPEMPPVDFLDKMPK